MPILNENLGGFYLDPNACRINHVTRAKKNAPKLARQSNKKNKAGTRTPPNAPAATKVAAPRAPQPSPKKSSRDTSKLVICAILFAVVLGVFWPCVRNDYINCDDDLYLTENPHVQQGFTAQSIKWSFTTYHAGNWHPLTWLSFILGSDLGG